MNAEQLPSGHLPPGLLLKSFVLVGGGYVLCNLLLFVMTIVIWWLFYPDVFKIAIGENEESFKQMYRQDPARFIAPEMFWILLVGSAIICTAIGWALVRFAPFGKFSHAVLLAVVLFVSYLQFTFQCPDEVRWMAILLMGTSPICVLLGANIRLRRARPLSDELPTG